MAGLATNAKAYQSGRVRCSASDLAHLVSVTKSLRFFPASRTHSFYRRAHQRRSTLAAGVSQAEKQKEWISNLRNFYRFLPFSRSTYRDAAAIIAGSSHTYKEFAAYREKLFFVPGENGINPTLYTSALRKSRRSDKLELIFVGVSFHTRLVILHCGRLLRFCKPIGRVLLSLETVLNEHAWSNW